MKEENSYQEKISNRWMTAALGFPAVWFLFVLIYQILIEPIGTRPAPNWFLLLMFLLFAGIAINFSSLVIKITSRSIIVGYGIFRSSIAWESIKNCYPDRTSAFWYGGWGIRIARAGGRWRKVYNILGTPRVVLSLKKGGFFEEFAFSTKDPDRMIGLITEKAKSERLKKYDRDEARYDSP